MDKTAFDKIVRKKAEERFNEEWKLFFAELNKHPFIKKLTVNIPGPQNSDFHIGLFSDTFSLFQLNNPERGAYIGRSNFEKVKAELLTKYEDEIAGEILEKASQLFDVGKKQK